MRAAILLALGLLGLLLPSSEAAAQQAAGEARRIQELAHAAVQPADQAILQAEQRFVVDYGFWINQQFSQFINDDNNDTVDDALDSTFAVDPRFWFTATLRPPADGSSDSEHSLYVRLKDLSTWRDPSNEHGKFDHDGPHVDYLFTTLDFSPVWVQAGRRFFGVGQGLAYSNVGDGIELSASGGVWSLLGFASRSVPHEPNIDLTVPGGKHSGRTFYGIEGRYIGIPNRGIYGFLVVQRDDADEEPITPTQDFAYNSEYFGIGSEGTAIANVRYAAEVIFETGESFTSLTDEKQTIRAWAMDVSLVYDVQAPFQPTIYGEYTFGSGDADRLSVTDTIAGNAVGRDRNFLYFGYLPTGYALSPRVSNLRMLKVGVAIKPLEGFARFKDLTISADLYRYFKDEKNGGVFDVQASASERDIGMEVDLTLSWPILSDLSMAVEYGHFEPGEAYPVTANDDSEYLSVALTSTF